VLFPGARFHYHPAMAVHDFISQRLYVEGDLSPGRRLDCSADQANYLINVLRLRPGAVILVFNGRDGEWRARMVDAGRRGCALEAEELVRPQEGGPDVELLFAPLKRARLDYMAQKAVEMGVARLRPVLTRRTIAERVNLERMRANVVEAAEQCGVLRLPEVAAPERLALLLASWSDDRRLIWCDEAAAAASPLAVLSAVPSGPLAVLIGPEGGFAPEERAELSARRYAHAISLGPRVMRADTAAVAALALVNAVLGDWR
jgi:16S rRNA (uracil1498-N3)-methyltransferase